MPMTWNELRTDSFTGVADNNYSSSYAPTNYASTGSEVGMKNEALCLRDWATPGIRTTGVAGSVSVGNGGRVRAKCSSVSGGLVAGTYGYAVEANGAIYSLFFGMSADASTDYYRATAIYENSQYDAGLGVRLAIQTNVADPRIVCEVQLPSVTTLVNKSIDAGFIVVSSTVHLVFCRLYDTDGTTLLGECSQLLYNDWGNSPGVTAETGFGLGGQWITYDDIKYYDYALTGSLQTPDAYVQHVSQSGVVTVYGTPGQGGTGPYTYQWEKNTNGAGWGNVSGGTSLILKETGVTASTQYRLKVTDNAAATATSAAVSVTPGSSVTLLATGDSITEGNGSGAYTAYNYALKKAFADNGKTLYMLNFGAGATTSTYQSGSVLTRYTTWINRVNPDAFIARIGTNDAGAGVSTSTFASNLAAGTETVTVAANLLLLYLCSPWTGIEARQSALETYDAVFVARAATSPSLIKWQGTGVRTATNGQTTYYPLGEAGDELHPVKLGYAAIAPLDYTFINDNLVDITSITIDQGSAYTVPAGTNFTFTATVVGNSTANVWSKDSGSGSINSSTGVYAAPEVGQDDKTAVIRVTAADGVLYDTINVTILGEDSLRALGGGGTSMISVSSSTALSLGTTYVAAATVQAQVKAGVGRGVRMIVSSTGGGAPATGATGYYLLSPNDDPIALDIDTDYTLWVRSDGDTEGSATLYALKG